MMKFQIKHKYNGSVLFERKTENFHLAVEAAIKSSANLSSANLRSANLSSANLRSANLSSADLRYADLRYANLSSADLRYADLRYANLSYANLSYADLRYATLRYAEGVNKHLVTPLLMLLEQPGLIRAYKLVTEKGKGPFYPSDFTYDVGFSYVESDPNCDEYSDCGAGINLATLPWCIQNWIKGHRILIAEFTAKDIAAIPIATNDKFRVKRCEIVGEKDLKGLGLI